MFLFIVCKLLASCKPTFYTGFYSVEILRSLINVLLTTRTTLDISIVNLPRIDVGVSMLVSDRAFCSLVIHSFGVCWRHVFEVVLRG